VDVRQYLSSKGYQWREKSGSDGVVAVLNCPFCEDTERKFAISLEHGAYNCLHANRCGVRGSFTDFQRELGDTPMRLDGDGMFSGSQAKEYTRPKVHASKLGESAEEWLRSRSISLAAEETFKLGQKTHTVLMFPYFKDAELVQVKYRDIESKAMWTEKDAEPVLYNRDRCSGRNRLVITEGELDAISLHEYGITAASMPSGTNDLRWIENEWAWLEQFGEILLALDYDGAGQGAVEEVSRRLGDWRCKRVVLPCKDANECLMTGTSGEVIKNCMEAAQDNQPQSLLRVDQIADRVMELIKSDATLHGFPTAFDGLNKLLKGWRTGELTVWTGYNGAGKSTILNQVVLKLGDYTERACIASLEMPTDRLMRWMTIQAADGQNVHQVGPTILAKLNDLVYLVNTEEEMTPVELLNVFEYAARKYAVGHFIVDSLMRISFPSQDELMEQKRFCSDLVSFARKYSAHVHLVAHPRKGQTDQDRPGKVDVGGTSHITNLAHNVLVLWRASPEQKDKATKAGKDPADNVLYVVKNREWGVEGQVRLKFDPGFRCYREVVA